MEMHQLTERLKRHITAGGITQNQVAKSIGVSGGAISSWLSGTYRGDNEKLAHSIGVYLRKQESRSRTLRLPTVSIEPYRQIHYTMDIAAEETDIVLICGQAGTGKTTALKEYISQYGGIYIKVDKTYTQHRLINVLADKLGVAARGSAAQQTERIIHTLEDRDTLVVIDEADYLSDGSLEYLRQVVYDAGGTGLVLCGLPRLSSIIQNVRNDHDQLLSRIGVHLMLEDISPQDMEAVIDAAWPSLKKSVKTALIEASSIRWRSEPSPCLRTLEKMLKRLHLYTRRQGRSEPGVEDVREVAKLAMRRH